jgi:hypothetical protein
MGRYRDHRHSESLTHFRRLNQILVLASAAIAVLLFIWNWQRVSSAASVRSGLLTADTVASQDTGIPLSQTSLATPRLFPFSVIPGGARSAQQLENALTHDPVAAAHYAGFDVARTRVIRLDRSEAVYVSYRIGNQIYWTSKRLYVPAGETLLSDGEHEARTRCGNRLSRTPQLPVSPKGPSSAVLNGPATPIAPAATELPLESDLVRPAELPAIIGGSPVEGLPFIPPFVPIGGASGAPPEYANYPPPPAPGQPVPSPEPSSFLLLSAGLLSLLTLSLISSRRTARGYSNRSSAVGESQFVVSAPENYCTEQHHRE